MLRFPSLGGDELETMLTIVILAVPGVMAWEKGNHILPGLLAHKWPEQRCLLAG